MMPKFVRESEPSPADRVVAVNDQQRCLAVVRAEPVTSVTKGAECDVSAEVHLDQRRKISYLRDAKLKVATHLLGKNSPLALRFRRSPRRSRETRDDQPFYRGSAR